MRGLGIWAWACFLVASGLPAEAGVEGLVNVLGDLTSGRGSDAELKFESWIMRCAGRRGSVGVLIRFDPAESGLVSDVALGDRCPVDLLPFGSSPELALIGSRGLRGRPEDTVWLLEILCVWLASEMTSSFDCGLRACAIARGPAHCGRIGTATLARTKLASTVTGRTFSLIFSSLAGSATPKTMCCTLLYIRLHFLKASDCGVFDRSWR